MASAMVTPSQEQHYLPAPNPNTDKMHCGACADPINGVLSGPLNRLKAILSLLQFLDRYIRDREYDWEALSRIHARLGVLNCLVLKRAKQKRDRGRAIELSTAGGH